MKKCALSLLLLVLAIATCHFVAVRCSYADEDNVLLDPQLVTAIHSYQQLATDIIEFSLRGEGQDQSYDRLATFVDKFGSRISGSRNLENSIDYMLEVLEEDGLDNVHGEEVLVSHWVRNKEYATLLSPRFHHLAVSGLGSSVGTDGELTADAIVVKSFADLYAKRDQVPGKIVVYNQRYVSYSETVDYRVSGAAEASYYGAVATLIRSVTPQSIYSPHTGYQEYTNASAKIPTACITVEDAEMLARIQAKGELITITLYMEAENLRPKVSRNTVAEVTGSLHPEQVVLVSGHLDSWDVGQGAMDDGGGAFVSWQALSIVRQMGLVPKRTMRLVMWTDEEGGGVGSQQYFEEHKADADNFNILFESDLGVFTPYGIQFTGSHQARAIMLEIGTLLSSINVSAVYSDGAETDTELWEGLGVPVGTIATHNDKYFWFHHTDGDTMTVLDPVEMNLCSAVFAVYSYILADMDQMLPRDS